MCVWKDPAAFLKHVTQSTFVSLTLSVIWRSPIETSYRQLSSDVLEVFGNLVRQLSRWTEN